MRMIVRVAKGAALASLCLASLAALAQNKKEFKFTVQPGASLTVINEYGAINVHPSTGRTILISATQFSDKVEVNQNQSGNRVELRTHLLQPRLGADQARVDYDVSVPPDVAVTVRSSNGPLAIERMHADVAAEGDNATIDVHDVTNAHVHVRSMSGPVNLANINNGHVEISSVSGPVTMNNVTGPKLEVSTTNGKISYNGNFGKGGDYTFTNHNADIDVFVPATASADISARSLKGSVENDLQVSASKVRMPSFAPQNDQGRSFAGTINSGASSVQIRSFSGKIRVKKQ